MASGNKDMVYNGAPELMSRSLTLSSLQMIHINKLYAPHCGVKHVLARVVGGPFVCDPILRVNSENPKAGAGLCVNS